MAGMCSLPSVSKKIFGFDPSIANRLFGRSMNNPDYIDPPPAPEKVVQRQVSKAPAGRDTFAIDEERKRRRMLAASSIFNSGGIGGVASPAAVGTAKLGGG